MNPETGLTPEITTEQFVSEAQKAVEKYLPSFTQLDRGRFDHYDPTADRIENGQQLWFCESEEGERRPAVVFIIKADGNLVTTFYNSPFASDKSNHLFLRGGSIYNYDSKKLQPKDTNLAARIARYQMEGFRIDLTTRDLPFALDENGAPRTLRDVLLTRIKELGGKSFKKQALLDWQSPTVPIFESLDVHPDQTRELLLQRLQQQNSDRVEFSEEELDDELARLDAYQEIVRVKAPHLERFAEFLE